MCNGKGGNYDIQLEDNLSENSVLELCPKKGEYKLVISTKVADIAYKLFSAMVFYPYDFSLVDKALKAIELEKGPSSPSPVEAKMSEITTQLLYAGKTLLAEQKIAEAPYAEKVAWYANEAIKLWEKGDLTGREIAQEFIKSATYADQLQWHLSRANECWKNNEFEDAIRHIKKAEYAERQKWCLTKALEVFKRPCEHFTNKHDLALKLFSKAEYNARQVPCERCANQLWAQGEYELAKRYIKLTPNKDRWLKAHAPSQKEPEAPMPPRSTALAENPRKISPGMADPLENVRNKSSINTVHDNTGTLYAHSYYAQLSSGGYLVYSFKNNETRQWIVQTKEEAENLIAGLTEHTKIVGS